MDAKGIPRGARVGTDFGEVLSIGDMAERFSSTQRGTRADDEDSR